MSPRHGSSRASAPWMAAACALLALAWFPCAARAFTFVRVGDGSAQSLTWFWSHTFANCTANGTCGNVASADGRIPTSTYYFFSSPLGDINVGGMLDWTASPGQLREVALPIDWAQVSIETDGTVWMEGIATIDARTTPLVFQLVAEPGDPPTTNLRITPRLDGGVYLLSWGPGSATASLQLFMSVDVNGQQVSRDSLVTDLIGPSGIGASIPVAFPRGAANVATVNVSSGAEVTIRLWAYEKVHSLGKGVLAYGESSYGQTKGPALIVDVQTLGTAGVGDEAVSSGLHVQARPNPLVGTSRVAYQLPRAADVRLSIYDLTGARVATLVEGRGSAASGEVLWSGTDSRGRRVAPGVYVVELAAGDARTRGKLVVLGR